MDGENNGYPYENSWFGGTLIFGNTQKMAGKWDFSKQCHENKKTNNKTCDGWWHVKNIYFCTMCDLNQSYRISEIFCWCKIKPKLEAWVSNLWVTFKLIQKQAGHPKMCQCHKRLISKLERSLGQKNLWFLTFLTLFLRSKKHSKQRCKSALRNMYNSHHLGFFINHLMINWWFGARWFGIWQGYS